MLLVGVLAISVLGGRASSADPEDYERLLAERTPALVTVKFVLKLQAGFMGEHEQESEIPGVMIDSAGVVLCCNNLLVGFSGLMGGMGEITATPTDIKVLIGDDPEGMEAELITRDSELDLAWIEISDPGDATFAFVDFSDGAEPRIGDRLVSVRRMSKHFARSAVIAEGRLGGRTSKPRDLFLPMGDLRAGLGLPVYTVAGRAVGFTVMQMLDAEGAESIEGYAGAFEMESMMNGGLVLPSATVVKATRRALSAAGPEPDPEQ
jgi:hypothetical protein